MPKKSVFDNKDFQIKFVEGIAVVTINLSRPTLKEAKEFKLLFATLRAANHYKIIIDLRHSIFADSVIIGIIVTEIKEVRKKAGDIVAITKPGRMRILFAQTGLHKIIKQFNDIDTALASLSLK